MGNGVPEKAGETKRPKWLQLPKGVKLPRNWRSLVNKPITDKEEEAIQRSIRRGTPYGEMEWAKQAAARLGLESTMRKRGRPKKLPANDANGR
jgi:putative transposase